MKQYYYVIINNAGHSWPAIKSAEGDGSKEPKVSVLQQLLQEGCVPVRETPMGGGTSHLAHSLILLEKADKPKSTRAPRQPR
ncbi:MAG TPA: hypothetical protein VG013_39055 [Gemmataceae bacterium]|jgi:hypothetical protein|nr:hypothetical protein [Gemmataceae bacterium]